MIRAFLGIDLPPALRGALQLQQFLLPMPRKVEPESLHLTLVFLGDCPEPALEAAHEGFQTLRAHRFLLSLQGLGLFGKAPSRRANTFPMSPLADFPLRRPSMRYAWNAPWRWARASAPTPGRSRT